MKLNSPISPIPLITLILLLLSVSLNIYQFIKPRPSSSAIPVIGVIDGDTLVLEGKVRLRLRHLDAPELNLCGGPEAKQELENLVSGKSVDIAEKILDQRGRAMSLVYVDDTLVNREMLASGWARYHHDQSTIATDLKAVADAAKAEAKGIFGPKCRQTENFDRPDCVIKGNLNDVTGEKKYYLPGCTQYNTTIIEKDMGEQWFCSEKEALDAGYVKSLACPN